MKAPIFFTLTTTLIISVALLCAGCKQNAKQNANEATTDGGGRDAMHCVSTNETPYTNAEITAVIIPSENNTFGYDIYVQDAVLIHQPSRPGLPGNLGFATKEDAMKVAELVIKKIRNNEMPPTVSIEELQELSVF